MLQGVFHQPYGHDDLYSTEQTERFPRDPTAGDTVYINASTWPIEGGQTVWVTWTKNGVDQPAVGAQWASNTNSASLWSANLGQFVRGDVVEYRVHANENQANEQVVGPFTFNVTSWSGVTKVGSHVDHGTSVDLQLDDTEGSFKPVLRLAFATPDTLHVQFSPTGQGLTIDGQKSYSLTESATSLRLASSAMVVVVQKAPYKLAIYRADGHTLITQQYDTTGFRNLGWASDGKTVITRIEDHYQTTQAEVFTGFGERYDFFNLNGHDVNTFIYNQYVNQAATGRTYLAVPFYLNSAGYGVFVNTTAYSTFNIATFKPDLAGFTINTTAAPNPCLEYYVFTGGPKTILDRYTSITGRPLLPPKWAFGIWVSANEWNSQAQVTDVLNAAEQNQIPITALVLEQWSDEATFYVWWGAQYTPSSGGHSHKYADFTFPADGLWHDPKAMVADAHNRGVHIVLWQAPVLRERFAARPTDHYPAVAPPQQHNDLRYAVQQGYVATDGTGGQYRLPPGWFGGSLVPDFTNAAATSWWMSKRSYLVDEVKIDGFKCDGGEAVFGRFTTFSDGRKGDVMHNGFPSAYLGAYNSFVKNKLGNNGVVFARAGSAAPETVGIYWAGDQASSFEGFQEAIRAGLCAGQSGVPFWGWDLAGFSGNSPSAELYLRATAMATFCPIMQLHSQWSAPGTTQTRLPWQIQAVTGDPEVVPTFRMFANVRMNLLPYIYSEAKRSSTSGTPLMRAMAVEFPGDPATASLEQQYMFGDRLLVAPITQQGASSANVYVPIGEWYDFWYSAQFSGPSTKSYGAGLNAIPVYAAPGAIIPLNLNPDYELGGAISNSVGAYANLTFRIYPSGQSTYDYFDDATNTVATLHVNELWSLHQVSVVVPALSVAPALQVIGGAPGAVTVDGVALQAQTTLAGLQAAPTGWYWDPALQATVIKLQVSTTSRTVALSGVDKAAYQAEFANFTGAAMNTNHANYTGFGFVDQFDTVGDSVTFAINADTAGEYSLKFRYANALGTPATRNIYLDGQQLGSLSMPPLPDWDSWGTASVNGFLTAGRHQVQVRFDNDNRGPINLDSLSLVWAAPATVAVLTRHNDNGHTGANLQETSLTPARISPATFGHLFSYPVRGQIFAQPLYVSGINIPGRGIRNVLYVATMHNQVYAFDADNPYQGHNPFWQRSLEPAIPLPDPNIGTTFIDAQKHDTGKAFDPTGQAIYRDIVREVGILSTPVISRQHNAIYVVTASKDPTKNDASAYSHHLHALDLTTGAELVGGPVVLQGSATGAGYVGRFGEPDAVANGQISFVSHRQLQRSALLLTNDTIFIAFASYGDKDCYHGWVLAYAASTLKQTALFNTSPTNLAVHNPRDTGRGGIWQAGEGPAADDTAIYFLTGNGGFAAGTDFSDCFVKLRPTDLTVLDWFTPFNTKPLAEHDLDVGSAGALLIPGTDLLIGGGKESKFFLLKRDQMGHFDAAAGNGQIVQHFYVVPPDNPADPIGSAAKDDGTGHHIHGSPIFWEGPSGPTIYVWAEDAPVKAFAARADGTFPTTPLNITGIPNAQLGVTTSQGNQTGLGGAPGISPGMPGGSLSLSANASAAGSAILWACHPLANANQGVAPGIVRAFDASNLAVELWNTKVNAPRDDIPSYAKFCPPTVANGKVYVPTFSDRVMVYGLF
jgi:alpha-glucosidase (family GH31 glycosyl hydrolase)